MTCPSCDKSIREYPCVCGYAPPVQSGAQVRSTYQKIQNGVSKEQFGLHLYRAVECVGGLIFLQDQYNHAVHVDNHDLQGQVLGKKKKAVKELTGALEKLTPQEMTELLQRYPFVASL